MAAVDVAVGPLRAAVVDVPRPAARDAGRRRWRPRWRASAPGTLAPLAAAICAACHSRRVWPSRGARVARTRCGRPGPGSRGGADRRRLELPGAGEAVLVLE